MNECSTGEHVDNVNDNTNDTSNKEEKKKDELEEDGLLDIDEAKGEMLFEVDEI